MITRYSTIPLVSLLATRNDAYGFFEAIALGGLENETVKIPVSEQRRFFNGHAPFGKRGVRVTLDGTCQVYRSVDFGRDFDIQAVRYDFFAGEWISAYDGHRLGNEIPR